MKNGRVINILEFLWWVWVVGSFALLYLVTSENDFRLSEAVTIYTMKFNLNAANLTNAYEIPWWLAIDVKLFMAISIVETKWVTERKDKMGLLWNRLICKNFIPWDPIPVKATRILLKTIVGICSGVRGRHSKAESTAIVMDDGMFGGMHSALHELGHLGKLFIIKTYYQSKSQVCLYKIHTLLLLILFFYCQARPIAQTKAKWLGLS